MKNNREESRGKVVLKAGFWFTVCNVLLKGIGFLSTPVFTRLLTTAEYGAFSNIATWYAIFLIAFTWELSSSLARARFEFAEDLQSYRASLVVLGWLLVLAGCILLCAVMPAAERRLSMPRAYIYLIMVTLFFSPSTSILLESKRYEYQYRFTTAISVASSVMVLVVSVLLILLTGNGLLGRAVGYLGVTGATGLGCMFLLLRGGVHIRTSYWRYATKISFPLMLHLLSMYLLGSFDKIMIVSICGEADNGLYSLGYSCGLMISFLWTAMNSAISPWIGECLAEKRYDEIRKITLPYLLTFILPALFVMLVAPELVYFMGGTKYSSAIYVIAPVMASSIMQFIYTLYVNVEQFEKKTWGVALGTASAAGINIALNAVFIPRYGFIAAAYTTLVSYLLLVFFHYWNVRRMKLACLYDNRVIFCLIAIVLLVSVVVQLLLPMKSLRYAVCAVYLIGLLSLLIRNKARILSFFKKGSVAQ